MKLLPYETLTLETTEPLVSVRDRLARHIEAPKIGWNLSRDRAPYQGRISSDRFQISRVIHYRNSFLPVIRGSLTSSPEITVIHIAMTLHPLIIGFLSFFYLTFYSGALPIALLGGISLWETLLLLGFPLLILFAFWCAFWFEVRRSQRDLRQIILGGNLEATV